MESADLGATFLKKGKECLGERGGMKARGSGTEA